MPNTKIAKKMVRVSERRRERNKPIRTLARTMVARTRKQVETGTLEEAEESLLRAVRALDRAAQKGVIHRRNAARRKSRLAKMLRKARVTAE